MDCHICHIMSIATIATCLTQFVPYFYIELQLVIAIRKCNYMSSCKTPIVFMMFLQPYNFQYIQLILQLLYNYWCKKNDIDDFSSKGTT